jgi:translation initiation factor IF-3
MTAHKKNSRAFILSNGCKNIGEIPKKKTKRDMVRVNGQIKCGQVDLLDANGDRLGIQPLKAALKMAKDAGIDLVELKPKKAAPSLCMLIDFGLFRFRQMDK